MRLNHPDYIKLVTEAYKKKRSNNELSLLLAQSTPANIRRECANVYEERFEKKDERFFKKDGQTLRAFFGPGEHGKQFLQLIRGFETDKFKPLDNYLKGNTEKTEDKNVELLAWLIDFQHRPFSFDSNLLLSDEELSLIKNTEEKLAEPVPNNNCLQEKEEVPGIPSEKETAGVPEKNEEESQITLNDISKNNRAKDKSNRPAIIFILIIFVGGIYAVWQQTQGRQLIMGNANTGCMYWSVDHYEPVPCNEEPKGRLILPLNEEKIKNFKKITKEDTITESSIGKVFYIKDSNTIKYYTEGGSYPENVTRTLKVLTRYMYDTHLRKKEISVKDSIAN